MGLIPDYVRVQKYLVGLKTKFEEGLFDWELNPFWGGLGLCQCVVITSYILTHDVTLIPDSQNQ